MIKILNKRILEVRKSSGLTQEKFADRIRLTRNFVWMIEKGERVPSDRTISDICREFGVNEIWLREGIGEMFQKRSRSEELAAFFGDVQAEGGFKEAFLTVLARLGPEEWELIERKARELAEEIKKADPSDSSHRYIF